MGLFSKLFHRDKSSDEDVSAANQFAAVTHAVNEPESSSIISDDMKGTLQELARSGNEYWKFSQSSRELKTTAEPDFYADYNRPGEIINYNEASMNDGIRGFSFTTQTELGRCSMYGDQVTHFVFDEENPQFRTIMTAPYHKGAGGLQELQSPSLLIGETYSINSREGLHAILDKASTIAIAIFADGLFTSEHDEQEQHYNDIGCPLTAAVVHYIQENYELYNAHDAQCIRENVDQIIDAAEQELLKKQLETLDLKNDDLYIDGRAYALKLTEEQYNVFEQIRQNSVAQIHYSDGSIIMCADNKPDIQLQTNEGAISIKLSDVSRIEIYDSSAKDQSDLADVVELITDKESHDIDGKSDQEHDSHNLRDIAKETHDIEHEERL